MSEVNQYQNVCGVIYYAHDILGIVHVAKQIKLAIIAILICFATCIPNTIPYVRNDNWNTESMHGCQVFVVVKYLVYCNLLGQ